MAAAPFQSPSDKSGQSLVSAGNLIRIALLIALVGGAIYAMFAHAEWFEDPKLVKAEVLSLGIWGPLAFMALYAIGPSLLVPCAVRTVAGGLAFGTWWGSVYSLIGADLGALIAFAAGRFLGRGLVERFVGHRFHHLMQGVARHGFQIIFYLRLVPIIPYNA